MVAMETSIYELTWLEVAFRAVGGTAFILFLLAGLVASFRKS